MKLIFLYTILIVWLAFKMVPYDGDLLQMFPLAEVRLPFKTWLYFALEHCGIIMLSFIIWQESYKYRFATWVFFLLQVGDLIDYILTYNSPWFGVVSYNTISVIIFTLVIIYEYVRVGD